MANAQHLRLVSTFSDEAYPYVITRDIDNPYNPESVRSASMMLRRCVALAGITQYKLFEEWDRVQLHLKHERDIEYASFAATQPDRLEATFEYDGNIMKPRAIKKRCKIAEQQLGRIFTSELRITADTGKNQITMVADKAAYLLAARLQMMNYILNITPGREDTTDTPSKAERNSPPTPGRSPGQPG